MRILIPYNLRKSLIFKSVYKHHSRCEVILDEPVITDDSLCYDQVSAEEISNILSSLDVHNLIHLIVLKERAESLAPSVTAIVNFGSRTGLQLTEWKKANMSHPFRKRAKKIWLKLIAPYLCFPFFLKFKRGVWSPVWSPMSRRSCTPISTGFKKGSHVVLRQLLEVFHKIGCALDRGFESDIIYLDFAKAFDSLCPAKLVSKLKAFWCWGSATQVVPVLPHRKETESSSQWHLRWLKPYFSTFQDVDFDGSLLSIFIR